MGKRFGFAKSKYIERFIQETKLKPEVFGLEHVESMISKWIPQDANASEIVCKNAMQLKGKTLRVQQSLHKILK